MRQLRHYLRIIELRPNNPRSVRKIRKETCPDRLRGLVSPHKTKMLRAKIVLKDAGSSIFSSLVLSTKTDNQVFLEPLLVHNNKSR
jgi:hypothetical protein